MLSPSRDRQGAGVDAGQVPPLPHGRGSVGGGASPGVGGSKAPIDWARIVDPQATKTYDPGAQPAPPPPATRHPPPATRHPPPATRHPPPAAAGYRRFALLLAVLMALAIVLFRQTPQGTVRLESDDPQVEIVFDQDGPIIRGVDREPIKLRIGEHDLLVKRGDFSFQTDKLLIKKDETVALKVELLGSKLRLLRDGQLLGSSDMPL